MDSQIEFLTSGHGADGEGARRLRHLVGRLRFRHLQLLVALQRLGSLHAAAEAMRRILIDNARRKQAEKNGGQHKRQNVDEIDIIAPAVPDDILALDDALSKLEAEDPLKAQLVKLRYFAGMTEAEAADILGISLTTAQRHWRYARVRLLKSLKDADGDDESS